MIYDFMPRSYFRKTPVQETMQNLHGVIRGLQFPCIRSLHQGTSFAFRLPCPELRNNWKIGMIVILRKPLKGHPKCIIENQQVHDPTKPPVFQGRKKGLYMEHQLYWRGPPILTVLLYFVVRSVDRLF